MPLRLAGFLEKASVTQESCFLLFDVLGGSHEGSQGLENMASKHICSVEGLSTTLDTRCSRYISVLKLRFLSL